MSNHPPDPASSSSRSKLIGGRGGVVVGGSAGGMEALVEMLLCVPETFCLPVVVVQHLHKTDGGRFSEQLNASVRLPVSEIVDKQSLGVPGVYVAPANYHVLVEREGTLALSTDPKVNWARPSIDVLFESAARAWGEDAIAVILSGANEDGARGMRLIRSFGGTCIAQSPDTAQVAVMPRAAIALAEIDSVMPPAAIGEHLVRLAQCGAPADGISVNEEVVG